MSGFLLSPQEIELIENVPDADIFHLYCEFDLPWVEEFELGPALPALTQGWLTHLEQQRGLPISSFDIETLQQATTPALRQLATRFGLSDKGPKARGYYIRALQRRGARLAKNYGSESQIPWLLPFFLSALLRHCDPS